MPQNRDKTGRFTRGHSGNPGGRKAVPKDIKVALEELVPESVDVKRRILRDENAPLELKNKVAESVLDRVYGRPGPAPGDGDDSALLKLDELLTGISAAAKRDEDTGGR